MLLITVTNWKHKAGVFVRLILFLVLIGLIIPQFFSFISEYITSFKSLRDNHPPALRVEKKDVSKFFTSSD